MQRESIQRRPTGTGSLLKHRHRSGAETWYGKWRVDGRQMMRKLGPARHADGTPGLSPAQAEAALHGAIGAERRPQTAPAGIDIAEAGRRYIANRELLGVRPGTLIDYESYLRVQIAPFFGDRTLDEIGVEDIEDFIATKRREGRAINSLKNYVGLIGAIFTLAGKRGWCETNPVRAADKPREAYNRDIRYLTASELEAVLAAVPETERGALERVLYLTAAMTGLRRGELLALRWQDVDFEAGVIRVRRTFSRGHFGMPKSRQSNRAVPLASRVSLALRRLRETSRFNDDVDLAFGHPRTGRVLDPTRVSKRFKRTVHAAGLRPARFHDLRHSFATRMAAAGAPLRAIQEWMGHSDYRTTMIYAHYAPELAQGAIWAARAFDDDVSLSHPRKD